MLKLLLLEQLLGTLAPQIQAHLQGQQPGSPEEAATLVDRLHWEPGLPQGESTALSTVQLCLPLWVP